MLYMGQSGYVDAAREIVETAKLIKDGIRQSKVLSQELQVCYEPVVMVVAFKTRNLAGKPAINVYSVGDCMTKKNWNLNALQNPPALHICCTLPTTKVPDVFLHDLEEVVSSLVGERDRALAKGEKVKSEGNAAIYGMASSVPDKRLVGEITCGYLDALTALVSNEV